MNLVVKCVSVNHWLEMNDEWNELVRESGTDRLFMSHEWLTSWWDVYSKSTDSQLIVLLSTNEGGAIYGALPVYITRRRRRGILVKTAVLVGNLWRTNGAFISENQNIPTIRDNRNKIIISLLTNFITNYEWDELVIPFFLLSDSNKRDFKAIKDSGLSVRLADYHNTYSIDLSQGIENYKKKLSYNSRRNMFTYRKRLNDHGGACIHQKPFSFENNWCKEFNVLAKKRWSRSIVSRTDVAFLKRLSLQSSEINLITTSIFLNNAILSSSLDIQTEYCQYNLLLAFDASLAPSISPGLLHLGYLIEMAATKQIKRFDLLAGPGRSVDYKKDLSDTSTKICTQYIVRKNWLSTIYRITDLLK